MYVGTEDLTHLTHVLSLPSSKTVTRSVFHDTPAETTWCESRVCEELELLNVSYQVSLQLVESSESISRMGVNLTPVEVEELA